MNPAIHRFSKNEYGRDFVVSDLHGMVDKLDHLLESISFSPQDRLFVLGDLVDRGNRCPDALSLMDQDNVFSILGNHDYVMLQALQNPHDHELLLNWGRMGGDWYVDDIDSYHLFTEEWIEILSSLPYAIELETGQGTVGLVHANCSDNWGRFIDELETSATAREIALWDRSRYHSILQGDRNQQIADIDTVFFGHTVVDEPLEAGNTWYIDTGAFTLGSRLTMARVHPTLKIIVE